MSAGEAPGAAPTQEQAHAPGRLREQVVTLLVALGLALLLRTFVVEPFRIPSGSMLPTLLVGDHLFVNKFAYGVALPGTGLRLPGLREPRRGDVIVFTVARSGSETCPVDVCPDMPREEFVKRIVGLPGDRIDFDGDRVLVNGDLLPTEPLAETFVDDAGRELELYAVNLPQRSYRILDDPSSRGPRPRQKSFTVAAGHYFTMGDNRDYSRDSRVWGTVRLAEIKGPAFVKYWSWDFNGGWTELADPRTWWRLLTREMRWSRIGEAIH